MAQGSTSGAGGSIRAHAAAATGPVFRTRLGARARAFSDRTFERLAPARSTGPGTVALSFADRLMQPYLRSANRHRDRVAASMKPRQVDEDVTWLFPVPWYADELAWQAAAMTAARAGSRAAAPRRLEARGPGAPMAPVSAPPAPSRRGFSPILPLPAVAAAELVADLFSGEVALEPSSPLAQAVPALTVLTASAWDRQAPRASATSARPRARPAARREAAPPASRTEAASPPTAAASAPAAPAAAATAPLAAASPRARAAQLLAEVARRRELDRSAPSAAPPIGLRPDLGGLDAAVEVADAVHRPLIELASAPSLARLAAPVAPLAAPVDVAVATQPAPAETARSLRRRLVRPAAAAARLAPAARAARAEPPRALAHVAWTDRWLARFAGASPAALASLEVAVRPTPRPAPSPVFLAAPGERRPRPRRGAPAPTSASAAPRRRPSLSVDPTLAPREDTLDSDAAFAAISASLVRDRKPGSLADPGILVPAGPAGPAPSALAEAALLAPVPWTGPGLAPALGSSPVTPALAAALDTPASPTFDVRALALPRALAALAATPAEAAALATAIAPRWAAGAGGLARLARLAPSPVYAAALGPAAGAQGDEGPAPSEGGRAAIEPTAAVARASGVLGTDAAAAAPAHRAAPPFSSAAPAPPALSTPALVRRSPAPGAVAQMARSFASARALAVADLAYDFVSPEVIAAARVYGFDANEAARAVRLAEAGEAPLAALKDAVAMTFVRAVSSSFTAAAEGEPSPPAPAASAAGSSPAPRPALTAAAAALPGGAAAAAVSSAARRRARGATLWPEGIARQLDISRHRAEDEQPRIGSALELLAAGAVADAAVWVQSIDRGLDLAQVIPGAPPAATDHFAAARDATSPTASGDAAPAPLEVGEPEVQPDAPAWLRAAAAQLPAAVRPAFEAIYVALAQDPGTRDLPAADRAARALAVARRSSSEQPLSAQGRAALAWSVLPTVLVGGAEPRYAEAAASLREPSGRAPAPGVHAGTVDTYGGALTPVAPSSPPPPRHYPAPTAAPALVRTGPTQQMVDTATRAAAGGERNAQAAMPTMEAIARGDGIPDWFVRAAAEISSTDKSSHGISLAEMTLVTATPRSAIAASPHSASGGGGGGGSQASHPGAGGAAGEGSTDDQPESPDLEQMVHELAGMLRDYFDIQRMRNGEP